MGITSAGFLCFYIGILVLYYIIPRKHQWKLLLLSSIIFFVCSSNIITILYPLAGISVTYFGARKIEKATEVKRKKIILSLVVVIDLFFLVLLKYVNFGVYTYNAIAMRLGVEPSALLNTISLLMPLGLSFYTLSLLGYVYDVYYGIGKAEKNLGRFALFGCYFPTMVSGPIIRYRDMDKEFFKEHPLNYQNITFGVQRILWGFFKELVISERLAIPVNAIYQNYDSYGGMYIVLATILFALQLYTNFSGAMDIIIGVSETFGVVLPENFNTPFFSKSMQEFWRRWHITLGGWLKDYLFYPTLRSPFFTNLPKRLKDRFGKKAAKQITTFSAMFILWFTVGLWHGGAWKYIIGSGILHWIYIVLGEALEPAWKKLRKLFHITKETKWFVPIQQIRTFLLVCSGFLFFNAASASSAIEMYKSIFTTWNPEILWNGSLFELGLEKLDVAIVVVSLVILYIVSLMKQKGSVREWLKKRNIVIRWLILYGFIIYVVLLGNYGPGYSAAEFIYQGF